AGDTLCRNSFAPLSFCKGKNNRKHDLLLEVSSDELTSPGRFFEMHASAQFLCRVFVAFRSWFRPLEPQPQRNQRKHCKRKRKPAQQSKTKPGGGAGNDIGSKS